MAKAIVDITKDNFGTRLHFIGNVVDANRANASEVLLEALREVRDYFEDRADAEYDPSGACIANEEMKMLAVIDAALAKATP